jgi:hypothetical protein
MGANGKCKTLRWLFPDDFDIKLTIAHYTNEKNPSSLTGFF